MQSHSKYFKSFKGFFAFTLPKNWQFIDLRKPSTFDEGFSQILRPSALLESRSFDIHYLQCAGQIFRPLHYVIPKTKQLIPKSHFVLE